MEKINYTVINHTARNELGLSWLEYGLADLIYNLANNPQSDCPTWCYASKDWLAETLGISRMQIHRIINTLLEKNLIERHPTTKFLKSTSLWFSTVVISKEKLQPVTNSYTNSKQMLHEGSKQMLHNKDIYNKDNNKRESTPAYLQNLSEEELEELSQTYRASPNQIAGKAEDLYNYCQAHGKRYKNYRAFLLNAIKKDFGKRSKVDEIPEIGREELASFHKMQELKDVVQAIKGMN